jgi:hypothetical protein
LQDRLKFTQTGIFGLKIYHLATLLLRWFERDKELTEIVLCRRPLANFSRSLAGRFMGQLVAIQKKSFFPPTAGLPDFSWSKHTKTGKIYQMTTNYPKRPYFLPQCRKIFLTVIKSANIFHSKALQNLPKLGFLV